MIKKLVSIVMILAVVSGCKATEIAAQTVSPGEGQEETETEAPAEEPAIRVLLVGNSFTKHTSNGVTLSVEQPLEEMAEASGRKLEVETVAHGSAKLSYYAGMSSRYMIYYWELLGKLLNEKWDYIIIQEQTTNPITYFRTSTYPAVESIKTLVETHQPQAKLWLYMTSGYTLYETTQFSSKIPHMTRDEMQEYIAAAYFTLENRLGVEVVPVGMQFGRSNLLYPSVVLEGADKKHPAWGGYYLAACCFYRKIFGEKPAVTSDELTNCTLSDSELTLLAALSEEEIFTVPRTVNMYVGDSCVISAVEKGTDVRVPDVVYKSFDQSVIRTNSTGVINATGVGSTAVMVKTPDGREAVCNVTVEDHLSFAREWYLAGIGDKIKLLPTTDKENVKWSSSNRKIATVDAAGNVTARQPGVVTITVQNLLDAKDAASYQLYVSLPRTTAVKVREVNGQNPTSKSGKLKLSWKQVAGATKYNIYRSTSKTGTYTLVGTSNSNTFVDTSVPFQKVCYYKVAAGNDYDLCMGELSAPVRGIVLKSPVVQAKRTNRTTVKLSWKRNTLANGYIIYRSTKSMTGYKKIATITSNKTITYKDRVTAGKTYYYRIKAYRKIDGITYRSIRSKNVVVKK